MNEAIAHWKKALDIDPKNAFAHYNLGVAQSKGNRWDAAIDHFKMAVQGDSKFIRAYSALSHILLQLGRYKEAQDATRRCLELLPQRDPMRPVMLQQLRRCEEALRNQPRAIQ